MIEIKPKPRSSVLAHSPYTEKGRGQRCCNVIEEKGKMLCMVSQRRKKDHTYVVVKVDSELNEEYLCLNVRSLTHLKVHVYFFDSLSTTIREFRTIKSCEFFPAADIILDPSQYLCS